MSQYIFTLADTKAVALAAFNANFTEVYSTLGTLGTAISDEATTRGNADTTLAAAIVAKPSLGETSATAYRGDRGKIAYDFSQNVGTMAGQNANAVAITGGVISGLTGNLTFATDNTNDIGAASASRPGKVYAAAQVWAGTTFLTSDSLGLGSVNSLVRDVNTGMLTISTNASDILLKPASGIVILRNGTADQMLILGAASGTGGGVLVLHQIITPPTPTAEDAVMLFDGTSWTVDKPVSLSGGTIVSLAALSVTGGTVVFASLPTSDPANTGQLYTDAGFLKVSGA